MNPYQELGVPKNASTPEIKRAYKKRASKAHPDRAGGSLEKMTALNCAYALLTDEARRSHYDRTGEDGKPRNSIEAEAQQLLGEMFTKWVANPQGALIAMLRFNLQNMIAQIQTNVAQTQGQVKRCDQQLAKLKRKKNAEERNPLRDIIEAHKRALTEGMANGNVALERCKVATTLLDAYVEAEEHPSNRGTWTYATSF